MPTYVIFMSTDVNGNPTANIRPCYGYFPQRDHIEAIKKHCENFLLEYPDQDYIDFQNFKIEKQEQERQAQQPVRSQQPTRAKIYIIKDSETGYHKIGVTTRTVEERMKEIAAYNPNLSFITAFNGIRSDEKKIHAMFDHTRVMNEWFILNDDDINEIAEYFNQKYAQQ